MNTTIIDYNSASDRLGVRFRASKSGPERDLVEWFLKEKPVKIPRGCHATIFCEPRLESGFPDLVVVIWNKSVVSQWNHDRPQLSIFDLRILQFLQESGPSTSERLKVYFGSSCPAALQRLSEAKLVRAMSKSWAVRSTSKSLAIRRILAFEAKVNSWEVALSQAVLNTWFATESFILIPKLPNRTSLLRNAKSMGVGVYEKGNGMLTPPKSSRLPQSYPCWLFNEYLWRASKMEKERLT